MRHIYLFQNEVNEESSGCHGYCGVQIKGPITEDILRQNTGFGFLHQQYIY